RSQHPQHANRARGRGFRIVLAMSAIGPKQTSACAPHMSAFGGKADMTFAGSPLSRSLLGVKRTWACALHMSANDPKRTSGPLTSFLSTATMPCPRPRRRQMRRRDFIKVIAGSAAVWPDAAWPQQPNRIRRVSVLVGLDENDLETKTRIKAFRLGMRDLGWIEGGNVQIEYRFAGSNLELINKHVAELIRQKPDVIVANSAPVMAALKPATSSIPIVIAMVNDPVGQGIISNLARPGRNITGFSFIDFEIIGKWVDLLSDAKLDLSRVALMFNPETASYYDTYLRLFKDLPRRSSIEVVPVRVRSVTDIETAIANLASEPDCGLIAASDVYILAARETILTTADRHRIPVISPYRQLAIEGALISYGPDTADIFRRSASYVDRILKGESPGNLPFQSPAKFELVVNLKKAKALGLFIRESFLRLADEIIE